MSREHQRDPAWPESLVEWCEEVLPQDGAVELEAGTLAELATCQPEAELLLRLRDWMTPQTDEAALGR